jgi:hypothetical protein
VEIIAYFPFATYIKYLKQHGPHRKTESISFFLLRVYFSHGNVFTEQLPNKVVSSCSTIPAFRRLDTQQDYLISLLTFLQNTENRLMTGNNVCVNFKPLWHQDIVVSAQRRLHESRTATNSLADRRFVWTVPINCIYGGVVENNGRVGVPALVGLTGGQSDLRSGTGDRIESLTSVYCLRVPLTPSERPMTPQLKYTSRLLPCNTDTAYLRAVTLSRWDKTRAKFLR